MGNNILNGVKGTNQWKEFNIKAVCDSTASEIRIGLIHQGEGKAWFDNLNFSFETVEQRKYNQTAKKYIDHVCEIISKHSLRKDSIDLQKLKIEALGIAGKAKNYADCHLATQYLISSLKDHHSFLMKPKDVKNWQKSSQESTSESKFKFVKHRLLDDFGYLEIPGFHSNDRMNKIKYADAVQMALRYYDQLGIKGWIIDLRNNDGGNMEPMLAGLGPLFNADTVGYLVDVYQNKEPWGYKNGAPFSGSEIGVSATNPVKLIHDQLPIAVITGPKTGSSGEIIVISFIGNKNTKSFGNSTFGISTGNGEFDLLDGAKLFLTSTIMADRNGKKYGGKINPDFVIEQGSGIDDQILKEAIDWLKNQDSSKN